MGRLTRDPEAKSLPSGIAVTNFSVATSRTYNDRDGKRQEDTEYHNVVVFGKQAESCAQFLKKGQIVTVVGRLQTRSWEKDGQKQYRTEIFANQVQFGPRPGGHSEEPSVQQGDEGASPRPDYYPAEEIDPEDIPF